MNLSALDWAIVAAYFAFSTIVGLVFTKRGGESLDEFFLSGRDVPWWLAGTSMVATTFAADTPLLVTGLVANHGVAGNWLWWNMVMSGMLTVFFFARLWRRAGVMTDVEFAEIRYSGKPAAVLRGFRAIYLGLLMNVLIMGWVTRAMIKILTISLGINPITAVAICFLATVLYAAAGGLWAVLWTDLVQFIVKMGAVIVLAVYAVRAVGGIDKLKAGVTAHFGSETAALSVMPIAHGPHGFQAYAWMPLLTIGVFIAVQWWASWYPGAEPGGGGYVAQRIFAAKTERDGVLATLLFQVAHYALRPWPWIITGLATVILYPNLADKESGYVHAFVDLLPTPWRGVMMAGFAAAYMSTIGTQLNWGASYIVNDFYKRFLKPNESDKHYVAASRLATIALFGVAIAVTSQLSSIERVQKYLLAVGAGTGLVLILRWYWSRLNAWSELSAMVGSLVVSTIAMRTVLPRFAPGDPNADAWVMIVTVGATTVIWLTVTMLTPKEPAHVLDAFNKRVRPHETNWALSWSNWVAGIVAVYGSLFGIGKLIFGETAVGLEMLAVALAAFAWIGRSFRTPGTVAENVIYSADTRRSEG
jgi:solute:Na+ symporter, SSS family